jgi:LPPG:FO 2-phospho-L-lactate transferase
VLAALAHADIVVIGPSNPLISIAPILRVLGPHVPRDRTVAISPIVGGAALKGPTVAMMRAMGVDASPIAVAGMYSSVASLFVVDSQDASLAPEIEELGYRALVTDTVMTDGGQGLAAAILDTAPARERL